MKKNQVFSTYVVLMVGVILILTLSHCSPPEQYTPAPPGPDGNFYVYNNEELLTSFRVKEFIFMQPDFFVLPSRNLEFSLPENYFQHHDSILALFEPSYAGNAAIFWHVADPSSDNINPHQLLLEGGVTSQNSLDVINLSSPYDDAEVSFDHYFFEDPNLGGNLTDFERTLGDMVTVTVSEINTQWYHVEINDYVMNMRDDPNSEYAVPLTITGTYDGPLTIYEDPSGENYSNNDVITVETLSYNNDEFDFYLHPYNGGIYITDPANTSILFGDRYNGTAPTPINHFGSFIEDIVYVSYEYESNYYVNDTQASGISYAPSSGNGYPLLIRDNNGTQLSGDATSFECIARNQENLFDPNTIIYSYNNSYNSTYGHRIYRLNIDMDEITQTYIAGGGISPNNTQVFNGSGSEAYFSFVEDIAVDYNNTIYVADGHSIRLIDQNGNVTTFAGQDENGNYLGLPTDYETTHVMINGSRYHRGFTSVSYDAFNDRIIATHIQNEIWAFWMENGVLQSELIKRSETVGLANGSLEEATFSHPHNVQVDPSNGDIYLADGNLIRRIRL